MHGSPHETGQQPHRTESYSDQTLLPEQTSQQMGVCLPVADQASCSAFCWAAPCRDDPPLLRVGRHARAARGARRLGVTAGSGAVAGRPRTGARGVRGPPGFPGHQAHGSSACGSDSPLCGGGGGRRSLVVVTSGWAPRRRGAVAAAAHLVAVGRMPPRELLGGTRTIDTPCQTRAHQRRPANRAACCGPLRVRAVVVG